MYFLKSLAIEISENSTSIEEHNQRIILVLDLWIL